ncbi:MAG TPA: hypothetical protein VNO50_05290 [Pyrinomonadaceae bacterium]|nr:hypothetical protein [Pyrinomonadaceae bacterium]
MNKSEAIARIARLPGASGIRTNSVYFANVNSSKDVWWLDIPVEKLSQAGSSNISLLLYDDRSGKLHYLDVPKSYFIDNQRRLITRTEKGCISLELSTDKSKMFSDVRPGGDGIDFSRFLVGTI